MNGGVKNIFLANCAIERMILMRGNSKSKAPFENLEGDACLAIQPRELEQTFCFVRHKAIDIVKKIRRTTD